MRPYAVMSYDDQLAKKITIKTISEPDPHGSSFYFLNLNPWEERIMKNIGLIEVETLY
jgi:hypothetical protein